MSIVSTVFLMILVMAALKELIPLAARLIDGLILWLARRPAARARQWRALSPVEQNLQRASHGAACIVLPIAAYWLIGPDVVAALFARLPPGARFIAGVAIALWFAFAAARLVAGWRRLGNVREGLLTGRAFCKLAVGAVLLIVVPRLDLNPPASDALFFLALWLAVTGLVRFVVLVRPPGAALPEVQGDIAANEFDWDG
jgi:hypothetical protein